MYRGFHEKGTPSYLGDQGWIDCRHWMSVHWKYLFHEISCICIAYFYTLYKQLSTLIQLLFTVAPGARAFIYKNCYWELMKDNAGGFTFINLDNLWLVWQGCIYISCNYHLSRTQKPEENYSNILWNILHMYMEYFFTYIFNNNMSYLFILHCIQTFIIRFF